MTTNERLAINQRIDKIIGSYDEQRSRVKDMSLKDRISNNNEYSKMREKLFKIGEKYGEEALALTMIECGNICHGVTANGKRFVWIGNNGLEKRSLYCGLLDIEGIGTIFTSGTIAKAIEYVIKN